MGGTDQYDKMVHGYSICQPYKGNRWILRVICMFKDFEFLNTYIIYKKHNPRPISRSHFFYKLAYEFLIFDPLSTAEISNNYEIPHFKRKRGRKSSNIRVSKKPTIIEPKVIKNPTRNPVYNCKLCLNYNMRTRTAFECTKCRTSVCLKNHASIICAACSPSFNRIMNHM